MIIGLILLFFFVKCITTYMLRIMKISHNCIYFGSAACFSIVVLEDIPAGVISSILQ